MKLAEIESPYGSPDADIRHRNRRYARALMAWALQNGYMPFATHLLYTQPGVLNDLNPEQRKMGMTGGKRFSSPAEVAIFGMNYGLSSGMTWALNEYHRPANREIVSVTLGDDWDDPKYADDAWMGQ